MYFKAILNSIVPIKILFLALCFCLNNSVLAQVRFKKGYFINNEGQKVNCFIRHIDKVENPTSFQYRLTENGYTETGRLDSVKAFEILNTGHKYYRSKVNIERSGSKMNQLGDKINIVFNEEVLFLRILIESKASLYIYTDIQGTEKYFYSIDTEEIKPLIHYVYQGEGSAINENNRFRYQLYNDFKCSTFSQRQFERLHYNQPELMRLFNRYNECKSAKNDLIQKKKGENQLEIILGGGLTVLELEQKAQKSAPSSGGTGRHSFTERTNQKTSPAIGISYTHIFPFNNGTFGFFVEPVFQLYKNKLRDIAIPSGQPVMLEINYAYLSLSFGIKRLLHLDANSKLSLKGGLGWNLVLNSSNVFSEGNTYRKANGLSQDRFNVTPYLLFSAGYIAKNKFSFGAQITSHKILLDNLKYKVSLVNNYSVILGVRL